MKDKIKKTDLLKHEIDVLNGIDKKYLDIGKLTKEDIIYILCWMYDKKKEGASIDFTEKQRGFLGDNLNKINGKFGFIYSKIINNEIDNYIKELETKIEKLKNKTESYEEYLCSEHWQQVRQYVLEIYEYRCAVCNSEDALQCHHRNYKNKGIFEKEIKDVIPLCEECHHLFHSKKSKNL